MKTRIKSIEECRKLLQIEVSKELVKKTTEEVYENIKKVAKIPGFRPGSAPLDLLVKHYSKDAKDEVLRRLIPEGYKGALKSHKVMPIGEPEISKIDFDFEKQLNFEAEVDTYPSFKLKNYKGIKVTKKRISVTDQEMKDAISRIQNMSAKYNDAARPVKKGDYAVCDVEAFMDGKLITKKNNNMWVQAEKNASLLGMGEELIGLNKGDSKEIESKLPDNYPDKKYAGKLAKFKIVVKEVKEKVLPELNDEFAKTMKIDSADTLKKEIETQLFARKENGLKIDMENQILDKLLKDNKFSIPSNIAKRQKGVFAKRLEMELLQKGLPKDEVDKKIKELDSKLNEDAVDKVRIYFMLDDIAAKENIEVNKDDVEQRLKTIASSTQRPVEEVKKYYEKEHLIGGLAEEIKEVKVLEFLLKNANATETK